MPTKKERELLSANGSEVFNKTNNIKLSKNTKDKTIYQVNYKANCLFDDTLIWTKQAKPGSLYPKNQFGIYDMIGNVSEMVSEPGISKGGSWLTPLEDCRVGKDQIYAKPQAWLGFRCVCLIN